MTKMRSNSFFENVENNFNLKMLVTFYLFKTYTRIFALISIT